MGQKTKEDADEFFDNYLKGQIPEGEDEDEDDEDDDDAFGEGEEEDGDEGEMPDEPEDESDGDGAFCEEEPEEKKAQSKRDKAKEMRKMHKGASMWLRCTYVRAGALHKQSWVSRCTIVVYAEQYCYNCRPLYLHSTCLTFLSTMFT